jgi:hypothetical protein
LIQVEVTNEDDEWQTFIKTLGLSDKAGMALLKAAGLVSIRVVKGKAVLRIEHEQWQKFLKGEAELSEYCDNNQSSVLRKDHSFINLGNATISDKSLYYTPSQQYRPQPPKPSFQLNLAQRQLKAQLRSLSFLYNNSYTTAQDREFLFAVSDRDTPNYFDDDSSDSEEEEKLDDGRESDATEDGPREDSGFDFGYSHTPISPDKFPLLYKIASDKESIDSGRINALIWELLALPMGKDQGVQFDFANESKGCHVDVPSHATEKAFLSTAGCTKSK